MKNRIKINEENAKKSTDIFNGLDSKCVLINTIKNQSEEDGDHDSGLVVEETRPEVAEPKRYMVILINDDFTPMEFVVLILKEIFNMDEEAATRVMLNVHTKGKGVCGVYSKDIAETKVVMVNELARENEHPLLCTMEQA